MSSEFLKGIQEDCYGRVLASEDFSIVPAILQRRAMTQQEILQQLSVRNARGGKAGACVIVLMPTLQVPDPNIPGPRTSVVQQFLVLENPTLNAASTGTGKSAELLAVALLQLFHHFIPFGVSQVFIAASNAIVPNTDFDGLVGYDVTISTSVALAKPAKVATPAIAAAAAISPATGSSVTLTCATGSAAIYYTTDGSYPSSANATATLYSAPFNVPTAATLRAAAQLSGSQPSDVAQTSLT